MPVAVLQPERFAKPQAALRQKSLVPFGRRDGVKIS